MESGSGLQWIIQARLHAFFTFMRPYALRMQPYAPIMHFLPASKKLGGSRAESTCKEPYALYATLLGVGPFLPLFLLRELHTVHTAAYGDAAKQALALLPVGIGAFPACENQKCIRRCIRISGRKAPIDPLWNSRGGIAHDIPHRPPDKSPRFLHVQVFRRYPPRPRVPQMPLCAVLWLLWRAFAASGDGWRNAPRQALHGRLSGAGRIALGKEAIRHGLAA